MYKMITTERPYQPIDNIEHENIQRKIKLKFLLKDKKYNLSSDDLKILHEFREINSMQKP